MFGFGRQLATSVSVVPLGSFTPKLSEIPAWRNIKDLGSGCNEVTGQIRKDRIFAEITKTPVHDPGFVESEKVEISNKSQTKKSNYIKFLQENDVTKPTFISRDEDYDIIDLDREISFGIDGLQQLASVQNDSVDYIITTNLIGLGCNINDIFRESFRILKEGGEICFSAQFSNMRVKNIYDSNHFLLKPQYLEDIRRSLYNSGFAYYQTLKEDEIYFHRTSKLSENLTIFHKTLNSFKISTLEDCSEDYGQIAIYKGTAPGQSTCFFLNVKDSFPVNQPIRVSGNTAEILMKSRYGKHFDVTKRSNHRGPFK